jgi:hypothetical protein
MSLTSAGSSRAAVAETLFATLKKELVYRRSWPTRQELSSEVFEYIEGFYNLRRRTRCRRRSLRRLYEISVASVPLSAEELVVERMRGGEWARRSGPCDEIAHVRFVCWWFWRLGVGAQLG